MTIEEKIVNVLNSITSVSTLVWSDNIHLQMNDDDANNYVTSSPMITYAEIDTSYSKAKVHWMYQVTVRSKDKLQANSIAEDIRSSFDMTREPDYNFARVPGRTPIFDYQEKMHWTALTLSFVTRKY